MPSDLAVYWPYRDLTITYTFEIQEAYKHLVVKGMGGDNYSKY